MKIHLIAIGGSIMHNLAITLQKAGHVVTGSDDEIYEPARSRLAKYGLLPAQEGWHPERIAPDLDLVILGMHARTGNPELKIAQDLNIQVRSFPAFVFEQSRRKQRIVVAGSHGKTSTTSMLLHVLQQSQVDFDYLVGAQIDGFETMVHLSDAPLIVMEGDEYLSSALDRVPKIWHYQPHISIITGVAWDHMNVFPTWDSYVDAFAGFLERMPRDATVFYDEADAVLVDLASQYQDRLHLESYRPFDAINKNGIIHLVENGKEWPLKIFGEHNLKNLRAAYLVLRALGISDSQFFTAVTTFRGAARRLQMIYEDTGSVWYQDFAHAPSKVKATTQAVKELFLHRKLTACVELHTYSSLNKEFLPQYIGTLNAADHAIVFFSEHTLKMKQMQPLRQSDITNAFGRDDLLVITKTSELEEILYHQSWQDHNLLLMSSGNFGGLNIKSLISAVQG